jgi:hypothetical protein
MGDDSLGIVQGVNSVDGLVCTAGDVAIATVNAIGSSALTCTAGSTIMVELEATLASSSNERRSDIGIWVTKDAASTAIGSGTCSHFWFPAGSNVAAGELPDEDGSSSAGAGADECGDLAAQIQYTLPLVNPQSVIEIPCVGTNGYVELDYCVAWKVPGQDTECFYGGNTAVYEYRIGTVPGTKSKCTCEKISTVGFQ